MSKLKGCITKSRAGHYVASVFRDKTRIWKSLKLPNLGEARRQMKDVIANIERGQSRRAS